MKITALVENFPSQGMKAVHGLALYIETEKHKILFDLGPDGTLFENAEKRNIDLSEVDTVIISHGHDDHGGALKRFLQINTQATIYVQRKAFEKHYAKILLVKVDIGLDETLSDNRQIMMLDGDYKIDDELELFTVQSSSKCHSNANDILRDKNGKDPFSHEQNLIIHGKQNVLVMGCGHKGIVNILEVAMRYQPQICVGGYHLYNPISKKTVSDELLDEISNEISKYKVQFYTCHCTGKEAYEYFANKMPNMHYLSCGESIEVEE